MKKLTLLMLFLVAGFSAMAQVEIGLMVSPTITGNRFIAEDRYNFEKENSSLRLGVGVVADYFFAQNYAFSTGLVYRSKGNGNDQGQRRYFAAVHRAPGYAQVIYERSRARHYCLLSGGRLPEHQGGGAGKQQESDRRR